VRLEVVLERENSLRLNQIAIQTHRSLTVVRAMRLVRLEEVWVLLVRWVLVA
jgi:hypothetical protein